MPSISWSTGKLHFKCGLGFIFLVLLLLVLMISAGFWQLKRAEYKSTLQDELKKQLAAPLIDVADSLPAPESVRFRQVRLDGSYDSKHQFLLDNRSRLMANGQRQVGYEVLTPFTLGAGGTVLVNRGWLPAPVDRQRLPDVSVATDKQFVQGIINIPEQAFSLGAIDTSVHWPRRIQFIDLTILSKRLETKLYPAVIMLDKAAPGGYARDWQPVVDGPAKHYGYVIQWFGMALATIILFGFFSIKRINDD